MPTPLVSCIYSMIIAPKRGKIKCFFEIPAIYRLFACVLPLASRLAVRPSEACDELREEALQLGVLSFTVCGRASEDVAQALADLGVAVRAGYHCAPLAHKTLATGESGAVRVSFSPFNSRRDVTKLVDVLKTI